MRGPGCRYFPATGSPSSPRIFLLRGLQRVVFFRGSFWYGGGRGFEGFVVDGNLMKASKKIYPM